MCVRNVIVCQVCVCQVWFWGLVIKEGGDHSYLSLVAYIWLLGILFCLAYVCVFPGDPARGPGGGETLLLCQQQLLSTPQPSLAGQSHQHPGQCVCLHLKTFVLNVYCCLYVFVLGGVPLFL